MNIRIITGGLALPEGPVELPRGDILVAEVREGRLTRVAPDGTKSTFAVTGGGPNGAARGPEGAIFVANNGGYEWTPPSPANPSGVARKLLDPGTIQRVSADGSEVSVAVSACNGEPLLAPNDLVFDHEGNLYFTDFGRTIGRVHTLGGLYYASADGRMVREVVFPMQQANGVGLSPDGRTVYVGETTTGRVWAFDLAGPGEVKSRRILGIVPGAPPTYEAACDSLCVDAEGNVLQATVRNGGITVLTPDGTVTHHPTDDSHTTNCCFGGPGLRHLYITLAAGGQLGVVENWPTPGLKLAF